MYNEFIFSVSGFGAEFVNDPNAMNPNGIAYLLENKKTVLWLEQGGTGILDYAISDSFWQLFVN
jgi:hypothetical protein